jgi:predicted TIM-barrel fold metal-dependent hydrolase
LPAFQDLYGIDFDTITDEEARTLNARIFKNYEDPHWLHEVVTERANIELMLRHARIQGSNPMLLVNLIAANPRTKFILFHGGYPWIGETGAIATRHKNVWIDSVWLPTISYSMAKRAFQEWLEVVPSNRILWGADAHHAEGIYAATEMTRRCLAEALAEKIDRGELREEHGLRIGRQILRENALELFPELKERLWKTENAR